MQEGMALLPEINTLYRHLATNEKHINISECDYMQTGPACVAWIPPYRKRARQAISSSCYRLGRGGKRAELFQIVIAQLTAQR